MLRKKFRLLKTPTAPKLLKMINWRQKYWKKKTHVEQYFNAWNMPEYGFSLACNFPYTSNIRLRENPYASIFYVVFVLAKLHKPSDIANLNWLIYAKITKPLYITHNG